MKHSTQIGINQTNLASRAATAILEMVGNQLWGVKPRLMVHFVDQHGAGGALLWFLRHMPRYERILKNRGPLRTHLLSSAISTSNGCGYCTFGHAYAFQLHYLKNHNRLFPLDEADIIALHEQGLTAQISKLAEALEVAQIPDEIPPLRRLERLLKRRSIDSSVEGKVSEHENTTDTQDADIEHLIKMFADLNACGINAQVLPDEAHDPINKNAELRARYQSLRRSGS